MARFPSLEVLPSQNSWTLAPCLDFRTSVSPLVAVAPTELSDVWKAQISDRCAQHTPKSPGPRWPWQRVARGPTGTGCRQVSQQSQKDSAQESIVQTLLWDCHFRLSLVSVFAASLGPGSMGGCPAAFGEGSKVTPQEVQESCKRSSY